jgi:hypothetical protein
MTTLVKIINPFVEKKSYFLKKCFISLPRVVYTKFIKRAICTSSRFFFVLENDLSLLSLLLAPKEKHVEKNPMMADATVKNPSGFLDTPSGGSSLD